MLPFLLSWVYPAASRVGWLTTSVANPPAEKASGLAYLLRGNGTIFTPGFGRMTDQLRQRSFWAEDLTCLGYRWAHQHIVHEKTDRPLVLIGHSRGGRSCLKLATLLKAKGIAVDLLICIDVAFSSPVPANVRRAVHLFRSRWRLYPARPLIPCPGSASIIANIDLDQANAPFSGAWLNHLNITNYEALQQWIVGEVKQLLPTSVLPPSA